MSQFFFNAVWLFLGIVAGAIIQHLLNTLAYRRQAKIALQVMQIEITYNISEVERFKKHLDWLRKRITASQINESDFFLPMQKFDYSSVGPLTNSGYFHVLLGPERVRSYLEFYHFFRTENGNQLTTMLKSQHSSGKSLDMIDWMESRADELVKSLTPIQYSKLGLFGLRLHLPKQPR